MPIIFLQALLFTSLSGYAQLNFPDGSQNAGVYRCRGITVIEISYSTPAVKGGETSGKLVPGDMNDLGFGTAQESPWRPGQRKYRDPTEPCRHN